MAQLEKILVAINLDAREPEVADWGARLAQMAGASLELVHVLEVGELDAEAERPNHQRVLDEELARLGLNEGIAGRLLDDEGFGLAGTLLRYAEDWGADLIVIGHHPRKGLSKLFDGSAVAAKVVDGARCAVLVAPPRSA